MQSPVGEYFILGGNIVVDIGGGSHDHRINPYWSALTPCLGTVQVAVGEGCLWIQDAGDRGWAPPIPMTPGVSIRKCLIYRSGCLEDPT